MYMKFIHQVSKGSRYNQIYIPKDAQGIFEVGDTVEVRLLRKRSELFYSKTLFSLPEFKKSLVKQIFSSLSSLTEISQVFIVGSFLTEKADYNDIDLLVVSKQKSEALEEKVFNLLTEKFQLKFHVLLIPQEKFITLQKICPLTRSMLYYFVSNKKFQLENEKIIDKNHIKFLLMMPEDLLEINANSRAFYDNLRRLIAIFRFLENKDLDSVRINKEISNLIGENLYLRLKKNEAINENSLEVLRITIKKKLSEIRKLL
jgi:predicted nucleotidyltransferase